MPSRDVNAATRMAEASWRHDKLFMLIYSLLSYRPSFLLVLSDLSGQLWICLLKLGYLTSVCIIQITKYNTHRRNTYKEFKCNINVIYFDLL